MTEILQTREEWPCPLFRNALILWLITLLSCGIFWRELYSKFVFLVDFFRLGLLALGIIFLSRSIYKSFRPKFHIGRLAATIMLGFVSVYIFAVSPHWGDKLRLYFYKSKYEKVVATWKQKLQMGSLGKTAIRDSENRCIVEPGPPLRIAFLWPGGSVDNWVGVVYDPSGFVSKAQKIKRDQSNWGDIELQEVIKLFGGDMFNSRQLDKDWYLCYFT